MSSALGFRHTLLAGGTARNGIARPSGAAGARQLGQRLLQPGAKTLSCCPEASALRKCVAMWRVPAQPPRQGQAVPPLSPALLEAARRSSRRELRVAGLFMLGLAVWKYLISGFFNWILPTALFFLFVAPKM